MTHQKVRALLPTPLLQNWTFARPGDVPFATLSTAAIVILLGFFWGEGG